MKMLLQSEQHGAAATARLNDPSLRERTQTGVAIAGCGLVTPLGTDSLETWNRLLAGEFIEDHARARGSFEGSESRVVQLARRAASEALGEARWSLDEEMPVVVGTSKGSIDAWLDHSLIDVKGLSDIAADLGRGVKLTVSGACASGLIALVRGTLMIRSGEAKRVLVVASESSLHPLFLASFRRLGVLPAPGVGCRPFDSYRDGFLMSEAAAAVCLETFRPDGGDGSGMRVLIDQVAFGGDASHLTAADPDGGLLRHLLNRVVNGRGVDLVHAHGTGTTANDPIELAAIAATVPGAHLYSHKGALGHSLGASGLVGVVLNVLSHRRGVVPPNIRTACPLPAQSVVISQHVEQRAIQRSIALAAGFGGAAAAVSMISGR